MRFINDQTEVIAAGAMGDHSDIDILQCLKYIDANVGRSWQVIPHHSDERHVSLNAYFTGIFQLFNEQCLGFLIWQTVAYLG